MAVQFAQGSIAHQLAYKHPGTMGVLCSAHRGLSDTLEFISIGLAVVEIWPCARCTATAQATQPLRKLYRCRVDLV